MAQTPERLESLYVVGKPAILIAVERRATKVSFHQSMMAIKNVLAKPFDVKLGMETVWWRDVQCENLKPDGTVDSRDAVCDERVKAFEASFKAAFDLPDADSANTYAYAFLLRRHDQGGLPLVAAYQRIALDLMQATAPASAVAAK